jgi:hypothetical protein
MYQPYADKLVSNLGEPVRAPVFQKSLVICFNFHFGHPSSGTFNAPHRLTKKSTGTENESLIGHEFSREQIKDAKEATSGHCICIYQKNYN